MSDQSLRFIDKFWALIARIVPNNDEKDESVTLYSCVICICSSDHECVLANVFTPKNCDIWSVYSSAVLIILKFCAKFTTRHKDRAIVINCVRIQSRVNACDLVYIYWAIEMLVLELRPSEEKLLRRHQIDFEYRI